MDTPYHELVAKIIELLENNNCWHEKFEHEAVKTSEDAAKVRTGYTLSQGAKALILKAGTNKKEQVYFMVVTPGDKKFDSAKVKKILKAKELRFATEIEVGEITKGVQFGGIPPFGNIFGLKVYADPLLFINEKIIFNAGDRRLSIGMYSKDFQRLVEPEVREIV